MISVLMGGKRKEGVMDYISREDSIEAITKAARKKYTLADWYEFYLNGMIDAEDTLKALPAEDVEERKTGKWEIIDEVEPRRYGCSNCKRMVWHIENFCPNCGAKMEG